MFICARCNKENEDNKRGSVGWPAKLGLLLLCMLPGFLWLPKAWSKMLCEDCCWGYRFIGTGCLALLGMAIAIALIVRYAPRLPGA
jgi:hypothetical protein